MKISVVMQSYLGDYPGSRTNPEFKFVRAVSSFLSQKHDDKELVIVSDGCEKTKQLYETLYSHDPRIKFAYVSKHNSKTMYVTQKLGNNTVKHYRGIPRQIGCVVATGEIITYMDSDDIILPDHLSNFNAAWVNQPEQKWASNPLRYIHKNSLKVPRFEGTVETKLDPPLRLKDYGYDINDEFYLNLTVPEGRAFTATYSLSHRKNVRAQWRDTIVMTDENNKHISGHSEDHLFFLELQMEGTGFRLESPTYTVCHFRFSLWDV